MGYFKGGKTRFEKSWYETENSGRIGRMSEVGRRESCANESGRWKNLSAKMDYS